MHVGSFVLRNGKRNMNIVNGTTGGFQSNDAYYQDTDSLYIEGKHWDKLNRVGSIGNNIIAREKEYKNGGIFDALFLAPKSKYCITFDKNCIFDERKTFKRFTDVSKKLEKKENFRFLNGNKLIGEIVLS